MIRVSDEFIVKEALYLGYGKDLLFIVLEFNFEVQTRCHGYQTCSTLCNLENVHIYSYLLFKN